MLKPRAAVERMMPYSPPTGGRAERLRLDFNENTAGCSPRVIEAIGKYANEDRLTMYPEYSDAMRDIARFFKVEQSEMTLANGTDEAIDLVIRSVIDPGGEVLIQRPAYAMYRFYAELAGASIREIDYRDDIASTVRPETCAVIIANPNNPTGSGIAIDEVIRILEKAPNAAVLIDEAYFEFSGVTALDRIRQYPNLFVSRTFSKAYGMAAMRCGCLFSNIQNMQWIKKAQSPYSVNMLAAIAARAAIEDREFVANYVGEVLAAREMACEGLRKLGISYFPSRANFILFDVGDRSSEIRDRLRERGVLVRDRSYEIPGCLRVTMGTREQIARFLEELERAL